MPESSYDITQIIAELQARVEQLETIASNTGADVTDDDGSIVSTVPRHTYYQANEIRSATEPTDLNQSTDVGTIWTDSDDESKKVWTGYEFVVYTGQETRGGPGLEAYGPTVLAASQSSTRDRKSVV